MTSMPFSTFALGMSAALPVTFIYVLVGTRIKDIHDAIYSRKSLYNTDPEAFIFIILTTIIALGALFWASIITKRHFDQIIEKASEAPDYDEEDSEAKFGPEISSNKSFTLTDNSKLR